MEPLYDCPNAGCKEKFTQKLLYQHIKSHTEEKYVCKSLCKLEFPSKYRLDRHNCALQHEKNLKRAIVCNDCGKRFVNKTQSVNHILEQHTRKYPCKTCGLCFVSNKEKESHSAGGCHKCNLCGDMFLTDQHLKQHLIYNRCRKKSKEKINPIANKLRKKITSEQTVELEELTFITC